MRKHCYKREILLEYLQLQKKKKKYRIDARYESKL